jgi:hypothetical protein
VVAVDAPVAVAVSVVGFELVAPIAWLAASVPRVCRLVKRLVAAVTSRLRKNTSSLTP